MWNCTYCHQSISDTEWTCWRCRKSRLNPANAYRPPNSVADASLSYRSSAGDNSQDGASAAHLATQYSQQITLRELFGLTTFVAFCCACFINLREDGITFVAMLIVGNIFGVAVGLMVTHFWRLPNDGSARVYKDEHAASAGHSSEYPAQ